MENVYRVVLMWLFIFPNTTDISISIVINAVVLLWNRTNGGSMDIKKVIDCLKADKEYLTDMKICDGEEMDVAIKAMEEIQQYREIGTIEEIKEHLAELDRWHTDTINQKIKNVFANTSTLICHNCDHKDDYIEELEAEIEDYHEIGTPEECREAVEKQK